MNLGAFRMALTLLLILTVFIASKATATSNTVESTALSIHTEAITAGDLAPPYCAHLPLTTVITAGLLVTNGTSGSDLILGSNGINEINGLGGDDCLVGGAGADVLDSGPGTDVVNGGPGLDVCLGSLFSSDTLINCEL